MKKSTNLSENLKTLRKQHNLTAVKLAKKLNISHAALASWETGRHTPHLDDLIKLATFFEISVDDLLSRPPSPKSFIPPTPKISIKNSNNDLDIFLNELHTYLKENTDLSENDLKDIQLIFELVQLRNTKKKK